MTFKPGHFYAKLSIKIDTQKCLKITVVMLVRITVSCKQLGGEMVSGLQNPKVSLCRPSEGIIFFGICYDPWDLRMLETRP